MAGLFSSPTPAPTDTSWMQKVAQQTSIQNAIAGQGMSQVNQVTPDGNLTYDITGSMDVNGNTVPRWTATTTLSPAQQALKDKQLQVTQGAYDLAGSYVDRIGAATAQPYSTAGAPAAPGVPQYNDQYRADVYGKILERAQPQQERDRLALETRLANQGIAMGNEAYRAGMDDYNRGVNDFRLGADIQAGADATNRFNTESAMFGMGTDARKNYLTEQQMTRMQPIQEISALMGTGGGQQYPQFQPTNNYQVAPVDTGGILGMGMQAQMANAANQQRGQGGAWGGLAGLVGTLGGAALMGPAGGALFGLGSSMLPSITKTGSTQSYF